MLKTLSQAPVAGKRILLRVAYDITLSEVGGAWSVPDDERIKATLPTIAYLLERGCSLVLASWLGRPKPEAREEKYKLDPVARHLSKLLGKEVVKLDETVGSAVEARVKALRPGEIVMVENTRFNVGEETADPELSRQMAALGEFVVYDAFAQSHRVHASTTGILEYHKNTSCAGLLMERELSVLGQIIKSPMEPFVVVLGGIKISDKLGMMKNVLKKASMMLIGGGLANTFLKASGYDVGGSLVEGTFVNRAKGEQEDPTAEARALLETTNAESVPQDLMPEGVNGERVSVHKIQLPLDVVIGEKTQEGKFSTDEVIIKRLKAPSGICGNDEAMLDIGPITSKLYGEIVKCARTIFWNGPMGLFEDFYFASGTRDVAQAIAESNGFSVVGGGDTESVVTKFHLEGRFGHVSTGGGASLELLAGEELAVMPYLTA